MSSGSESQPQIRHQCHTSEQQCHPALQSLDIISTVIETFDPIQRSEDLLACINAARVCRLFEGPASRAVWRSIPSFSPLWSILAGVSSSTRGPYEEKPLFDAVLQTKSYHDQTRWARFLLCASRVHCIDNADFTDRASFNHRSLHLRRGEHELVRVLVEHNSGKTFLPSLQTLYWAPAMDGDDETLLSTLLCSRSLVSLYLQQPGFKSDWPLVLKSDVHLQGAPLLRVLVIKWDDQYVNIPVTRILSSFRWLRHIELECKQLDPSDFERLGNSQSIEYIRCKITGFTNYPTEIKLPSTKTLKVVGHFEDILGFVASVEAPLLTEFLVAIRIPSLAPILQCVQRIRSSSLSANLYTLHLEIRYDGVTIIGHPVSLSSLLEPYYTLKTLQNLSIQGSNPTTVIMTDDDLDIVARKFRRLRSLSISDVVFLSHPLPPEWSEHVHNMLTLMVHGKPGVGCGPITILRHFALHCPHLIKLSLNCVSVSTEGQDPDLRLHSANWRDSVGAALGHPLRDLNLTRPPWYNYRWDPSIGPMDVGEYLDTLFPELDTVTLREHWPTTWAAGMWGKAVDEIVVRQRGRRASREKTTIT